MKEDLRRTAGRAQAAAGNRGWSFVLREGASGIVAALVTIAYCVSFSALLFQGPLQPGLGVGLAALLVGAALTGLVVALTSSLSPASAGPDTPAVAVMTVLSATIGGQVLAGGGGTELAVSQVLLAISISTLVTGLFLYLIGALRLGQLLRFVPYPVVGGFLAASGWLLITGAVEVVIGADVTLSTLGRLVSAEAWPKLTVTLLFAAAVLAARRRIESPLLLPAAFLVASVVVGLGVHVAGADAHGSWFIASAATTRLWWPIGFALTPGADWGIVLGAAAEIGAVCGVTAIALLLDVSSLEVARARSADLDREFRTNGLANMLAAATGGVAGNLSLQASVLIEEAGGSSRWSGVVAAVVLALVVMSGLDVAGLVPTPVLGGLLVYLGVVMLVQALARSPAERSLSDGGLAVAIMLVIIWFGYLQGVVLGLVGACLTFAFSYSRIGVIRRHLTRAEFASNVVRSIEETRVLAGEGRRVHIFWLSGFVFFGSSNGVLEEIRRAIEEEKPPGVAFVVLELSGVTGFDSSALLSLVKLRNSAGEHNVEIVLAGADERIALAIQRSRYFSGERRLRMFQSRNDALEWCEDRLLDERMVGPKSRAGFEAWVAAEFGAVDAAERIVAFFDRREIAAGTLIYEQGAPADTIDLVAAGRLTIAIRDGEGREVRLRTMSGHTVVGEMGFFRKGVRTASVVSEGDAIVYTLTRGTMERMLAEEPDLAAQFLQFIIRALSDRVEFANREIAALV